MRQYQEIKRAHPDAILFFRMGDFYEMFYEDAVTASGVLEIALTSRNKGRPDAVPLCGVPVVAAETYLAKLVNRGYRVAVCDQVEDPRQAKGIVRREVVRVVTPGTALDPAILDAAESRNLASFLDRGGRAGLAVLDLSTGRLLAAEQSSVREGILFLDRHRPAEILVPDRGEPDPAVTAASAEWGATITRWPAARFDSATGESRLMDQFGVATLDPFGLAGHDLAVGAASAAVSYARETQMRELSHVREIRFVRDSVPVLDAGAIRTLEISRSLFDGSPRGSLLSVVDETRTAMGGRLIREWLHAPLTDVAAIRERQAGVRAFMEGGALRHAVRGVLPEILDLERLLARVTMGTAGARDLAALRASMAAVPRLMAVLETAEPGPLDPSRENLDAIPELADQLSRALVDDPPATVREGGMIRPGWDAALDGLREIGRAGRGMIAEIERRERERTGIPSLKVRYNRVFGYYIEVTKAHQERVPADYMRKQTLVGAERFTTPELKEFEEQVVGADEKIALREYDLFQGLCAAVTQEAARIQRTAGAVAALDSLSGLAEAGVRRNYVLPTVEDSREIEIVDGRHPVVEALGSDRFVPNDTRLAPEAPIHVITGPNMAGKSTYMRQVALIVVLAQAGAPVPAAAARVGLVDRIFTRIGATDYISRGQSTFMVEMAETAQILRQATDRSLVILDEIGRGTSTFDGVGIAWAVAEDLAARVRARTLFATHYHELTELPLVSPGVANHRVSVREWGDQIVFLHKIEEGGADKSYGIHVGRLAGLPGPVIARAREILANLEAAAITSNGEPRLARHGEGGAPLTTAPQLDLFAQAEDRIARELDGLDLSRLTPIEALNLLHKWKGEE